MDFAARLRALMGERGLGVRALARAVPCDPGLVSRLAAGKARPSVTMAGRLDEVLGAGGELAALAQQRTLGADDADRLALALRQPSRTDARVVGSLAAVLAAQRRLEDLTGSAPMLAPVGAQSAAARALIGDTPAPLRAVMLSVAAQYAYFLAWLHENTGRLDQAARLYDGALGQATEAADANLVSELLSMKGHLAWERGDAAETARLSAAAQADPDAHPGQHAISAMQEACALAVLGDAAEVSRKIAAAELAQARSASRQDDLPPWLYYHSPGFFTVQQGRAWLYLGAHDPRYYRKAVRVLGTGVAALSQQARESEWGAGYLLYLARAHMHTGDAMQAVAAAAEAASTARRMESVILLARLRRLHAQMTARWPGQRAVAGLAEALH